MKSALVRTVCGYRIRQVGGIPFDDLQEAQAVRQSRRRYSVQGSRNDTLAITSRLTR